MTTHTDPEPHDHAHAIAALRREAEAERDGVHPDEHRQHRLDAAAALLEVHDATGINLAMFGPVGDFVNDMLAEHGFQPFTDNGA